MNDLLPLAAFAMGALWGAWLTCMLTILLRRPERPEPTQRVYLLTPVQTQTPEAQPPQIPDPPWTIEGDEWKSGLRPDGSSSDEELM